MITVVLHGADTPGYATLLTAVVALSGIQLVTLGVIGEYVGRIYHEAKHRPPYVVRETDATCRTLREGRLPTGSLVIGEPDGSAAAGLPSAPGLSSAPGLPSAPGTLSVAGRSAARSRTARQFGSFVLIGCVNTAVYLGVYASLNRWIPYLVAHVIGYAVSIVCSFLLNSYVTCRTKPTWRAFVRYPLSSLVNLVASGALLYGAVSVLGMDKNLAALAAGVIVTPISFLLARWAIMSGRRTRTEGASEVSVPEKAPQPQPQPARPTVDRPAADRPAVDRPMADRTLAPRSGEKG